MPGLFSRTVCSLDVRSASWKYIYKLFEDEGPMFTQRIVTAEDSTLVSNTTYIDVANSLLHMIAAG